MDTLYYKPSGKFSMLFFPYFLLLHVLLIPILSVIYIYLVYYIPIIYFNFLFAFGCGIAGGFVMTAAITWGKVRNNLLALLFGILAMCFMKYVQWCVYIPIVFSDAYGVYELTVSEQFQMSLDLLLHPSLAVDFITVINAEGVWSVFTYTFKGVLLGLVWVLEFLLMTATACAVLLEKAKFPFCEEEDAWYIEMPNKIAAGLPGDLEGLKRELEKGYAGELIQLCKEYQPDASQYLSLTFYKPRSSEHYYLKAKKVSLTVEKGKLKKNEEAWIEYLAIDNDSAKEIQTSSAQPQ